MTPEEFAEDCLAQLMVKFEDEKSYCDALEILIDVAQTALDAKQEEMEDEDE